MKKQVIKAKKKEKEKKGKKSFQELPSWLNSIHGDTDSIPGLAAPELGEGGGAQIPHRKVLSVLMSHHHFLVHGTCNGKAGTCITDPRHGYVSNLQGRSPKQGGTPQIYTHIMKSRHRQDPPYTHKAQRADHLWVDCDGEACTGKHLMDAVRGHPSFPEPSQKGDRKSVTSLVQGKGMTAFSAVSMVTHKL